jgi:hypothetical protein
MPGVATFVTGLNSRALVTRIAPPSGLCVSRAVRAAASASLHVFCASISFCAESRPQPSRIVDAHDETLANISLASSSQISDGVKSRPTMA